MWLGIGLLASAGSFAVRRSSSLRSQSHSYKALAASLVHRIPLLARIYSLSRTGSVSSLADRVSGLMTVVFALSMLASYLNLKPNL